MTQTLDQSGTPARSRPLWRRPWVLPMFVFSTVYIIYTAQPYLNEQTAPLQPHEGFDLYYPFLLGHIGTGTIALLISIFQVWPWLRNRHRPVHRWSGRVYVVSTLVSAALAFIILPYAPINGRLGAYVQTGLWVAFTVMGYIRIRQRRFADHRRMMIYAFAMVMSNLPAAVFINAVIQFELQVNAVYLLEIARWGGWILNLMLAQWWLNRTAKRPAVTAELRSHAATVRRPAGPTEIAA